jgi:hypothetical protein
MRAQCDDIHIRDAYPLMDQVAARDGSDYAAMDVYKDNESSAQ